MYLNPFTFGLVLVVAVGTIIYQVWNQNQQHNQNQHQHQNFRNPYEPPDETWDNSSESSYSSIDRKRSFKKKKEVDTCTICLNALVHKLKALTCAHIFHNHCITEWLKMNNSCPVCRHTVN